MAKQRTRKPPSPAPPKEAEPFGWYVYILRSCSRPVTYVGIAKTVAKRLEQHNGHQKGGAKSTRAARPWEVVHTLGPFATRSDAQEIEYRVKQLAAPERLGLPLLLES